MKSQWWRELKWSKPKKMQFPMAICRYWTSAADLIESNEDEVAVVGVDPGKNFGVAIYQGGRITAISGRLEQVNASRLGFVAVDLAVILGSEFIKFPVVEKIAMIEGAAYNARYGQNQLSEIRFGFAYGFRQLNFVADYIPPDSARKEAFGSAKITADLVWLELNHNAADAVGVMLAALKKHFPELDKNTGRSK